MTCTRLACATHAYIQTHMPFNIFNSCDIRYAHVHQPAYPAASLCPPCPKPSLLTLQLQQTNQHAITHTVACTSHAIHTSCCTSNHHLIPILLSLVFRAGPQLDLPHDVTPQQLEVLLNGLLQNEEKMPYSFYVEEQELASGLGEFLATNKVSVEAALRITYMPQAVFRVRPVARCTSSMPGEPAGNTGVWCI